MEKIGVFTLGVLMSFQAVAQPSDLANQKKLHDRDYCFLLMGHSNAEGTGGVPSLLPSNRAGLNPDILEFTGAGWRPVDPTTHWNHGLGSHVDLTLETYYQMLQSYPGWDGMIRHVRVSSNSSTVGPHLSGNHWQRGGSLFSTLELVFGSATGPQSSICDLDAVVMVLGVSDAFFAQTSAVPTQYSRYLGQLIWDLRMNFLGFQKPIVMVLVSPTDLPSFISAQAQEVFSAQNSIAGLDPRTFTVSAEGIAREPDQVHYNTAGILALGQRIWSALRSGLGI